MIWKATEWETVGMGWHANCTDNLAGGSSLWYHPARILGISPADFVELLVKEYKPDTLIYDEERNVLLFSWKSQAQMRKYKNAMNAAARKVNYQI
jgi:Uma2 family endonuclease